jgi:hypothetical protein
MKSTQKSVDGKKVQRKAFWTFFDTPPPPIVLLFITEALLLLSQYPCPLPKTVTSFIDDLLVTQVESSGATKVGRLWVQRPTLADIIRHTIKIV